MRRLRTIMAGITAANAGFAALQAQTAGTPLTLAANVPTAPLAGQIHIQAVPVTLTSASNLSAGGFTVVGLDRRGNAQTEIIAGPNATTVSGHFLFSFVSSITPNTTNAGTVSAGWGSKNYGPWLVSAFHIAAVVAKQLVGSGAGDFDIMTSTYNMLDPTIFLPQGLGGDPAGDMNFGDTVNNVSGPYLPSLPWPLVPASLQAAAPQLLSTVNCLPEDDGLWSEGIIAPTNFTSAVVPAAGASTGSQARLDPSGAFAWRIIINTATPVVAMDVNIIRPALS
jgi:hypothetical protein